MSDKRGGKREGAGRKKRDTEAISVRLSSEVVARIRAEAKESKCSLGEIVERYIKSEV